MHGGDHALLVKSKPEPQVIEIPQHLAAIALPVGITELLRALA
jgi:hypothetical protein